MDDIAHQLGPNPESLENTTSGTENKNECDASMDDKYLPPEILIEYSRNNPYCPVEKYPKYPTPGYIQ